jgi:hypothetical protein
MQSATSKTPTQNMIFFPDTYQATIPAGIAKMITTHVSNQLAQTKENNNAEIQAAVVEISREGR